MTALPINLRSRRKKMGWTQEKIATELSKVSGREIGRATYRTWETGEAKPNIEILPAMVELLLIDDLYLFLTKC